MAGGSMKAQLSKDMEQYRLLAQKPHIMWVFYVGPVSGKEYSSGYNVFQHEGWCIPRSLWRKKGTMPLDKFDSMVFEQARKLRILDDGTVRRDYNKPEEWWVMAPSPDANPIYGIVVRAQPPDRAMMNIVPQGSPPNYGADVQQRAEKLRADFGRGQEQEYPSEDDTWVESLRIKPDGSVEIYPKDGSAKPLMKVYKSLFEISTNGTKFAHEPSQTVYGGFATNPQAQDLPSTNTIPTQTFIPAFPEFLTVAAIAIAVAEYFNEAGQKNDITDTNETRDITPTEYIDYENLKREARD